MKSMQFALVLFAASMLPCALFADGLGEAAPALTVAEWLQGQETAITSGRIHVIDFWTPNNPLLRGNPQRLNPLLEQEDPPVVVAITLDDGDAMKAFLRRKKDDVPHYPVALDAKKKTTLAFMEKMVNRRGGDSCVIVSKTKQILWVGPARDVAAVLATVKAGTFSIEVARQERADRGVSEQLVKEYVELVRNGAAREQTHEVANKIFEVGARRPDALVALARIILIAPALKDRDTALAERAAGAAWKGSGHKDARAGLFYGKAMHQQGKLAAAKEVLTAALQVTDDSVRRALQVELGAIDRKLEASKKSNKGSATTQPSTRPRR
ncbi:MAG: hypothetical protein AAF581_14460 [Planctomycetota bacterium]